MRIFRMTIECLSPLHCGCGKDSQLQDQPVARDAFGNWIIPGASLAGALRELAAQEDKALADRLFGGVRASLVWCADARVLDYDDEPALDKTLAGRKVRIAQGPFLRDHVRIDMESETAEETGKFDEEFVPAGTRFALEFTFDPWDRENLSEELALFDRLCALTADGRLSLGGRSTSGMGRYRALRAECREFDLATEKGLADWLRLSRRIGFAKDGGIPFTLSAPASPEKSTGFSGTLEIPLEACGPIIVAGGSSWDSTSKADIVFASTPRMDYERGRVTPLRVIPGTSVKGVFRHAMRRICLAAGADEAKAEAVIRAIFGHAESDKALKGRLSFADAPLEGADIVDVPHVAVDRFSGGALDGALFSEGPVWKRGVRAKICLTLDSLAPFEAALLFHAVFDMAEGVLPLGGGSGRGCGRMILKSWPEEPDKALAAIGGTLNLNGSPLFPLSANTLMPVLEMLDDELKKAVQP